MEQFADRLKRVHQHSLGADVFLLIVMLMCILVYASSCDSPANTACIVADSISCIVALLVAVNCVRERQKDKSMCLFTILVWATFAYIMVDLLGWIALEEHSCNLFQYIVDTAEILIGYVTTMLFTRYVREFVGFGNKFIRNSYYLLLVLAVLFSIALLTTLPFGLPFKIVNRIYVRGPLYALFQAFPVCVLLAGLFAIVRNDKLTPYEKVSLSSYCLAPLIGLPVQFLHFGVAATAVSMLVSLIIVYNNIFMQRSKMLIQQDAELTQSRMHMMVSQIQPHFLYNTLTSIANICEKDPKAARQAIVDFSDYLRVNLDSLKCHQNVPFEKELEHCQTYLNFEKMRFEEDLNIEYDIQTTDFVIPILTVQPMLENAVKHGICNKSGGGTVRLTTYRKDGTVFVIIEDDGVGFDATATPRDDSRQHIGLENVRYRLNEMCGGTMHVDSTIGVGTKVTICLPEKKGGQ